MKSFFPYCLLFNSNRTFEEALLNAFLTKVCRRGHFSNGYMCVCINRTLCVCLQSVHVRAPRPFCSWRRGSPLAAEHVLDKGHLSL